MQWVDSILGVLSALAERVHIELPMSNNAGLIGGNRVRGGGEGSEVSEQRWHFKKKYF